VNIAIGVAGCGRWGANVVRDLLDLGATVFVADLDPARRDWARAAGARGAVGTVAELAALAECAGYVVVTPAGAHRTTCATLLERGVPVFVEKPPGRTLADVEALAALGADRLFVMHKWRYHPGVGALAALARDGALGAPIALVTTRTSPQPLPADVDVAWHLAVHDLAIALHVLGSVPQVEEARGRRDGDGRLVSLEAELRSEDGAEHHLAVAAEVPDYRREIRCVGSDATAVLTRPDAPALEVTRADGSTDFVPLAAELPLERELAAFLAHCDGGPAPTSSMTDALAIARCLAAIDERV
jgi:predicted dehydrogenase